MYGSLTKNTYQDFAIAEIKNLVAELMKLPRIRDVQFDLENWFISHETGELSIIKGKKQIVCSLPKDLTKP